MTHETAERIIYGLIDQHGGRNTLGDLTIANEEVESFVDDLCSLIAMSQTSATVTLGIQEIKNPGRV